jgi:hypothetical protein
VISWVTAFVYLGKIRAGLAARRAAETPL